MVGEGVGCAGLGGSGKGSWSVAGGRGGEGGAGGGGEGGTGLCGGCEGGGGGMYRAPCLTYTPRQGPALSDSSAMS